MKKQLIFISLFLFVSSISFSQEKFLIPDSLIHKNIVRVDSTDYNVQDFLWFYTKYSSFDVSDSLLFETYLDKFIEYRMKVHEAESRNLDTSEVFRDEFFKYLKITAHDRMYDGIDEKRAAMVKQEYDRLHWDYEVEHIFIKSQINSSPADTLLAWNKMLQVKNELQNGKSFEDCVLEYSDDNLSKQFKGNVGYITAMVSPYEYENALYQIDSAGAVVGPVRTSEGLYFIKVLNKRPTNGAVDAAIILIYPQSEDSVGWEKARLTIDSVYEHLQNGAAFDSLSLKYNTNERLRQSNGIIGLIDNGMPYSRELKETLFGLKNDGDYSQPIKLPYGYAICKRRWVLPLPGFEAYRVGYERRIESDASRNSAINGFYEDKMKQKLNFVCYNDELENCMQYIDPLILLGKWTAPELTDDATLFEISGEKYQRNDFFQYLQAIQKNRLRNVFDKDMFVRLRFEDYVIRKLELASMRDMEKNDLDFQYTMQEYHDGMIVYDLISKEIIQAAVEDSVGRKSYFNEHKENYMTEPRESVVTFTCKDIKTSKSLMKLLMQQSLWYANPEVKVKNSAKIAHYEQLAMPQIYVMNTINAKDSNAVTVNNIEPLKLPYDVADSVISYNKISVTNDTTIVVNYYHIASRQQTMEEAKEQLLIDYQLDVESRWLRALQRRHSAQKDELTVEQLKMYLQ